MKYKYISSILLVITGFVCSMQAQNSDVRFSHYTVEDGLAQNSVFAILQDRHGLMWFGTRTGGLSKFNGYSFTSYKKNVIDSLSISSNEILALCEDNFGSIWVGTRNGGVNRYDEYKDCFYKYTPDSEDSSTISSKTISCIFEDNKSNLWFGTNYGLCMYNRKEDNFIWHADKEGFREVHIKSIIQAGEDSLWIGSRNGLFLYNSKSREILKHFIYNADDPKSLSQNYVMALSIDVHGKLWVGTYRNGLCRLDDIDKGVFKHFINKSNDESSLSSNVIRTLHLDRYGVLWIGTKVALEKVLPGQQKSDNPVFNHYVRDSHNPYSLNHNSIFSFYESRDDNLWVGTYIGGVNQMYNGAKKFQQNSDDINQVYSLSNSVVSSFAETNKGFWVGTEGDGLNFFDSKTKKSKVFVQSGVYKHGLNSNYVKALLIDNSNDLWVGTANGLYLYDKRKQFFTRYFQGEIVYTIVEGIPGEIWMGTNEGLFKVDKSKLSIESYQSEYNNNGIPAKDINKVFKDSKGRIWVGSKTGLYKYKRLGNIFFSFIHNSKDVRSISNSHCTSINEDTEGNIWIGTIDGLNRLNLSSMQFEHFGETEGLPDNVINNIVFDDDGNLWITTNRGLSRIDKSVFLDNNKFEGINWEESIRNYDIDDGLLNIEFKLNASYKSYNGTLFFGGPKGYNFFHPDSLTDNPYKPEIVFTGLKLFNKEIVPGSDNAPLSKPIGVSKNITLSYKQSVVSIEFAALNYTHPSKNQYAYMLVGFDKDWNYIGNKHEATYTSLPAGNYVFKVKASNNDGVWNERGASIQINVTPPVWKRWWFRLFVLAVISFLIGVFFNRRIAKERKLNHLLEEKVLERTAELKDKNTLLSKQTKEIEVQRDKLAEANLVKDKLFSVIGHDLKGPFNSILGFSELLANESNNYDDEEKLSFAKRIYDSSKVIFDLITSLLLWSRSQMGTIKPVYAVCDLNELIESNIKIAELQAKEKKIKLVNKPCDEEFIVRLDCDLINTVIRNLISNAIKFTNIKGEIIISCVKERSKVIVCVKDNGIGISKVAQKKIFYNNREYISEGTNHEKGTGLGLLICNDFVKLHKGKIWLKSKLGKGSEFYFSLPIKRKNNTRKNAPKD